MWLEKQHNYLPTVLDLAVQLAVMLTPISFSPYTDGHGCYLKTFYDGLSSSALTITVGHREQYWIIKLLVTNELICIIREIFHYISKHIAW